MIGSSIDGTRQAAKIPISRLNLGPQRKFNAVADPSETVFEASRSDKLHHLEALGVDPWGQRFDGHMPIQQILALPRDLPEDQRPRVKAAGAS